jgi:hypothetical protein
VVWIGVRGTYALKEWGYERPSKGLFEAVADIVENRYEATGTPVPFAVIAAEMGKLRRVVKLSSLTFATHCNPRLRRVSGDSFVPRAPDDEVVEEIAEDELDRILQEFEDHLGDSGGVSAASGHDSAEAPAFPESQTRIGRLGSVLHHTVRRLTGTIQSAGAGEKSLTGSTKLAGPAARSEKRDAEVSELRTAAGTDDARRPQPVPSSGKARTLIGLARSKGLEVIDDRPRGGYLWIVGGKELYPFLSPWGFIWGPRGAPATGNRPGWYLLED